MYTEIKDLFNKERVTFNLTSTTKDGVINELAEMLLKDGKVSNKDEFVKAVYKREEEFSTGIGMGVAIPHGKSSTVIEPSIVFGRSNKGIDYNSMDGKPAYLFFMIAVPEEANNLHLKALSEISRRLMHPEVRDKLNTVENFQEFIDIFQ